MGQTVLSLNEVYQIYLKKQRKNKIALKGKLLRILERTMWFKLYFTRLIWIYLKFCQNRRCKWNHMHFYENWSIFSKWTIWVKPYCPLLEFFSDFAKYFGKCNAVPHVLLIKLVNFLWVNPYCSWLVFLKKYFKKKKKPLIETYIKFLKGKYG